MLCYGTREATTYTPSLLDPMLPRFASYDDYLDALYESRLDSEDDKEDQDDWFSHPSLTVEERNSSMLR